VRNLLLLFSLLVASTLTAQVSKLSGVVLEGKTPVPFASVAIEGTSLGTTTNEKGTFTIPKVPYGKKTLAISCIGYAKRQVLLTVNTPNQNVGELKLVSTAQDLDEVQITAKSAATKVREQAYAITSIDVKPLQSLNLDINQVLAKSSGVRIRESGGLGSRFDFSLNGFNGNQVRFFLDGIPMENFGSSMSLNNIPVNIAERIEVYKGVVPVHLGSDALGGAVNIVTNQSKTNYLDASYSYGSFNTHRTAISTGYTNQKSGFTTRANIFHNYSDNSYKVLVNKKRGSVILKEKEEVRRFHDAYDSKTAIVDIGFLNKKFADQLLFGIVLSESEKEQQTGATMEKVYGMRTRKSTTVMPNVRYKKSDLLIEGLDLNAYASYNVGYVQTVDTTNRTYYWDGSYIEKADPMDGELNPTLYKFTDNAFISRLNLSYVISKHHSVVANYTRNSVSREGRDELNDLDLSNREPKKLAKTVLGFGYKFDWNERLTVSLFAKNYGLAGLTHYTINPYTTRDRITRNLKQDQLGYGTAFSYKFPQVRLQLKGSVERAFRMPEAYELFGDGANVNGNVKLEPEESMNYNFGVMYELLFKKSHLLNFEVNVLKRAVEQFIRASVGTSDPTSTYTNEASVDVQGIEGSVRYSYMRFLRLSANATYQVQRNSQEFIDKNPNPLYMVQVPNQPVFFANFDANVDFQNVHKEGDKLSFGYGLSYFEEYFLFWSQYGSADSKKIIPTQFSHNVNLNYSLKNGKYSVSLSCNNLLDAELYDNFKLQKPGRSFNIKLRYFISK